MHMMNEKDKRGENVKTQLKDTRPKTKQFKKGADNCRDVLHPARFLRTPISHPSEWFQEMPIKRQEIFRNMPLRFMGAENVVNPRTIAQMHDRAAVLEMKHFWTHNSSNSKPLKEIRSSTNEISHDICWDDPETMQHIHDAISNYTVVLYSLWPLDPSGIILQRVLKKYRFASNASTPKKRIEVVTAFFNQVLESNARRAANEEVCLDFEGQERLLKEIMANKGICPNIPVMDSFKKKDERSGFSSSNNKKQSAGTSATSQDSRPTKKFQNKRLCFSWNDVKDPSKVCKTPLQGVGCVFNGEEFAHVCGRWLSDQKKWCFGKHRQRDHK